MLFSCDKSFIEVEPQPNDSRVLGFTSIDSKATITTANKMTSFFVFAYNTGTEDFVETTISQPLFMDNIEVSRTDSVTPWGYSPTAYWPEGGDKISFFAYSPSNSKVVINESNKPQISFTVKKTINNQIDLMYANAVNKTQSSNGGTVPMLFKHALTNVSFSFKGCSDESKMLEGAIKAVANIENLGNEIIGVIWDSLPIGEGYRYKFNTELNRLLDDLKNKNDSLNNPNEALERLYEELRIGLFGEDHFHALQKNMEDMNNQKGNLYTGKTELNWTLIEEQLSLQNPLKKITVSKIEIINIKNSGVLSLGNLVSENERWSPNASTTSYTYNPKQKLTTEFVKHGKCFMLIPQEYDGVSNAFIRITFKKNNGTTNQREYSLASSSWISGGVINYRFDFNVDEAKFE